MRLKRIKRHLIIPQSWRKPGVVSASLGINMLALVMPMVILQVYDRIIPSYAIESFTMLMIGLLAAIVLDTLLKIARSILLSWEGARFDHSESMNAMNVVLDSENTAFDSKPTGFYLDKMSALEQIQEFYSSQSILMAMDLPFVILFLALVWVIAGPLILVPVTLLGLFLVISVLAGKHLRVALRARSQIEDRRQNFVIEALSGIHTVKSMAMESLMLRRYERLQKNSAESVSDLARINSVVQGIGTTFSQLAVVCFAGIGSIYVISGDLTIGALAAGTMLSSRVLQPGLSAMGVWTQFQSVKLAKEKVSELLSMPYEVSGSLQPSGGLNGSLELQAVCFRYPDQEHDQLHNISLKIEAGESVSITGNNSAGKSTLIGLMSGFLHPNKGKVLLDGKDIMSYNLEYLRSQIGIVPQYGILFEGTILENMTLYREGEAIEQAVELSRLLGLDEIITRLPSGLDTQVGGAAVDTLSEGVRQKIIMVRSLVGHPRIMLFDDANANFDIKNDNRLHDVIREFKQDRTLVIVSHRPSFLNICDRHYVVANGGLHDADMPFSDTIVHLDMDKIKAIRA